MSLKENRNYGKKLAQATLLDTVDDPNYERPPRSTNWLTTWIDPVPKRHRLRSWLSMWLKCALKDIPPDVAAKYFREMADDIRQLDEAQAVDRFIDKALPKLLLNEPNGEGLFEGRAASLRSPERVGREGPNPVGRDDPAN